MATIVITSARPATGRLNNWPHLRLCGRLDFTVDGRELLNVLLVRDEKHHQTRLVLHPRLGIIPPGVRVGMEKAARAAYRAMTGQAAAAGKEAS